MSRLALGLSLAIAALVSIPAPQLSAQTAGRGVPAAAAGPSLTLATAKGDIQIRLFQSDAPKSVEHILDLVKRNF